MRTVPLTGFLCTATVLMAVQVGRTQTQPAASQPAVPTTLVTGKLVVPAEVDAFADRTLDLLLYEYDPRLADAPAKQIDHVVIKPFAHTKGQETSQDFKIGATGTLNTSRRYYVTAFVLEGTTRTHIGEVDGKSGLANVLTGGNPKDIKLVFRAVK
jgi:hypothetical protein